LWFGRRIPQIILHFATEAEEVLSDIKRRCRCTVGEWRRADLRPDYGVQQTPRQSVGWMMPPGIGDSRRNTADQQGQAYGNRRSSRRYFAIRFKDGSTRAVYPVDDDPLQFEEQVLSNTEGLLRVDKTGQKNATV
jgi:hypothetical protein